MNRRAFLAAALNASTSLAKGPVHTRRHGPIPQFGCLLSPADVRHNTPTAQFISRHCHMATSAGALYWLTVEPRAGEFQLEDFRTSLKFATASGISIRAHPLVWHEQLPAWVQSLSSAEEASRVLQRHIFENMRAATAVVKQWDVLNEPVAPPEESGTLRRSPWLHWLGEDFPAQVLRWARTADKDATIGINEFGIEDDSSRADVKRTRTLQLLERLAGQSALPDYLGIQGHLSTARRTPRRRLTAFLNEVRGLGIRVYVTELDVNDRHPSSNYSVRDAAVADTYEAFLETIADSGCVDSVTTWGLTDPRSWLQASYRRQDNLSLRPLLFDEHFRPKACWRVFRRYVSIRNAHLAPN